MTVTKLIKGSISNLIDALVILEHDEFDAIGLTKVERVRSDLTDFLDAMNAMRDHELELAQEMAAEMAHHD